MALSWKDAVPQQLVDQPCVFKQQFTEMVNTIKQAAELLFITRAEALRLASEAEAQAAAALADKDSKIQQLTLDSMQQQELVSAVIAVEKKMAHEVWNCKGVIALREKYQV